MSNAVKDVEPSSSRRSQSALGVIRLARRLFANTPIERLPITVPAYRAFTRLTGIRNGGSIVFRGVRLTPFDDDVSMTPALVAGYYERIELDIFEQLAARSQLVVDVGGNIGVYACVGALHLPAGARLVTFEPEPRSRELLTRNLDDNDLADRVEIVAAAVGASSGELRLFLSRHAGQHSAGLENVGRPVSEVSVPVVALDEHLAGPVDVIKIDVEGYDGFVLQGAERLMRQAHPTLLIEFNPQHLRACGFPPADFVDLVFDLYDHIFILDEPRNALASLHRDRAHALAARDVHHNLVCVTRPDHLVVVAAHADQ